MATKTVFKRWSDFLREQNISDTPTTNRFIARYKLATKFIGIDAVDISIRTLQGYSALMNVFLSYTAFETLIEGISENQSRKEDDLAVDIFVEKYAHPMDDDDLEKRIRANGKLLQMLINYADVPHGRPLQMERLMSFYLGDGGLHAIARQIRHLVAHGHLSAHGADATTLKKITALNDLAALVRLETYKLFETYVSLLENKYSVKHT